MASSPAAAAPPSDVPDTYALGRSAAETQRLILQHQIYGPLTRQFLVGAGVGAGMKVLDVGTGAGDVALLLSELVGPQGGVVGIDTNEAILETAMQRTRATGRENVRFHHSDLDSFGESGFDAVVGRWVLMYLPDPAERLRRLAKQLRPGGVVAFQEGVLSNPPRPFPPAPLHEQLVQWTTPPSGGPGPDTEMGLKLFRTFVDAGLPSPQLRLDAPLGGGPDWPGYAYLAATFGSLLPFLEGLGVVTSDQVDLETLPDQLRDEIVGQTGVQLLPPLIGAWSRT